MVQEIILLSRGALCPVRARWTLTRAWMETRFGNDNSERRGATCVSDVCMCVHVCNACTCVMCVMQARAMCALCYVCTCVMCARVMCV